MPHFIITSAKEDPHFAVRVASCDHEHAESVRASLLNESTAPDDLILTKIKHLHGAPSRWYRRFF